MHSRRSSGPKEKKVMLDQSFPLGGRAGIEDGHGIVASISDAAYSGWLSTDLQHQFPQEETGAPRGLCRVRTQGKCGRREFESFCPPMEAHCFFLLQEWKEKFASPECWLCPHCLPAVWGLPAARLNVPARGTSIVHPVGVCLGELKKYMITF